MADMPDGRIASTRSLESRMIALKSSLEKSLQTRGGVKTTGLDRLAMPWFMLVGTDAKADIPIPDNVRRYYFAGVTHGGGRGGFAVPDTVVRPALARARANHRVGTGPCAD